MSPENIVDKVLMLISRETVMKNRWEIHPLFISQIKQFHKYLSL
jgi:hypothetical protein